MSFDVTIQGQIKAEDAGQVEGIEQQISDALKGALAQFKEHITLASASFDYSGTTDLTPAPESGGGGGSPVDASGFVWRESSDATYQDAMGRLFAFNEGKDPANQVAQPYLTEDAWNAIVV